MAAVLARDADGRLVRKAGVMGIVVAGGVGRPNDAIIATLPAGTHRRLDVIYARTFLSPRRTTVFQPHYHLAQVNIARAKAALEDPLLADFVAALDPINALADTSPGFVWRLQTDAGDATAIRAYADDRILFNLSVWRTPEDLKNFVYRSAHADVMRERRKWFERFDAMYYALWWVPAGHVPSVVEAKARLEHLQTHGETAHAFSFKRVFPPPGAAAAPIDGFADPCPAA
jgi:hypothetical protein